jgi:hypothetical protein
MSQPPSPLYAVTDTNVLLDVHSCHDLASTYDRLHVGLRDAARDDPAFVYRVARARESLLLGIHFHNVKAATYSLHFEPVDLLAKRAPPAPGGATIESDFTTQFIHFVKEYVLPDWDMRTPAEPGSETSNAADQAYLDFAKRNGLPLITNEGHAQGGIGKKKNLREMAQKAEVAVFTPKEFYTGKIDESAEIEGFLQRFQEQAPVYMARRRQELGEDEIGEVLGWIYGYYLMILRGEVAGSPIPLRLTLR